MPPREAVSAVPGSASVLFRDIQISVPHIRAKGKPRDRTGSTFYSWLCLIISKRCNDRTFCGAAHRAMISPVWGDRFVRSFDPTFEPKEIRRLEVIPALAYDARSLTRIGGSSPSRLPLERRLGGGAAVWVAAAAGLYLAAAGSRRRPGTAVGRGAGVRAGYRRRERTGVICQRRSDSPQNRRLNFPQV